MSATPFSRVVESYLDLRWQLDPVEATSAGVGGYDHRFGDFTETGLGEAVAALRSLANALEDLALDGLDDEIDRTALLNKIRVTVHRFEAERPHVRNPEFWLSHLLEGLYFLLVREEKPREERALAALHRLEAIPALLAQARETLRECPRVFVDTAREVIPGGRALVQHVADHFTDTALVFTDAVPAALDAVNEFSEHLETVVDERPGAFAVGEEAIEYRLRVEHAIGPSAEQIEQYGRDLIAQTEHDLAEIAAEIDPDATWRELADRLRVAGGQEDSVAAYAEEMDRARRFVEDHGLVTVHDGLLKVVPTPTFLLPVIPFAAYQPPGVFEADRTGLFYVSNATSGTNGPRRKISRDEIPATAIHEGYPGHHLQFLAAHAQPRTVRKLMSTSVTYEGWAMYCEELMQQEGFYRNPRERFFQRLALLLRAVRIIADIGLHAGRMTVDEAVTLLVERAKVNPAAAMSEVRRYCATPAYQLSYAVGRRELLRLRDDYRASVGAEFSPRAFHDRVLEYGGLPIGLMRWGMRLGD